MYSKVISFYILTAIVLIQAKRKRKLYDDIRPANCFMAFKYYKEQKILSHDLLN